MDDFGNDLYDFYFEGDTNVAYTAWATFMLDGIAVMYHVWL